MKRFTMLSLRKEIVEEGQLFYGVKAPKCVGKWLCGVGQKFFVLVVIS